MFVKDLESSVLSFLHSDLEAEILAMFLYIGVVN